MAWATAGLSLATAPFPRRSRSTEPSGGRSFSSFAALFIVQGAALISSGLQASNTLIVVERDTCTATAAGLILYAMVGYSVIGTLDGHGWPHAPMFGVAPCPTTIFTLGFLILARQVASLWLAIIPVAWALIGSTAAVLLGVSEDLGLLAAVAAPRPACPFGRCPCYPPVVRRRRPPPKAAIP